MFGIRKRNEDNLMWIDQAGALARVETIKSSFQVKKALSDLIISGITVIPANLSEEICDQILREFSEYCAEHPEHEKFRDGFGLHDRLANLPLYSKAAQRAGLNRTVLEVVEAAFENKADIVGSLFFERGSNQDIHRDTPAFYTIPLNHYFGVWHALEDVHPDSGLLMYYEGGHKLADDSSFVGKGKLEDYFDTVVAACERRGLQRKKLLARKGDTVIWHPQLPHGGSEIIDKSKSRRSIVFHYKETRLPIYGAKQFFGEQKDLSPQDNMTYINLEDRRYVNHLSPKFYANKKEGNFKDA